MTYLEHLRREGRKRANALVFNGYSVRGLAKKMGVNHTVLDRFLYTDKPMVDQNLSRIYEYLGSDIYGVSLAKYLGEDV